MFRQKFGRYGRYGRSELRAPDVGFELFDQRALEALMNLPLDGWLPTGGRPFEMRLDVLQDRKAEIEQPLDRV